MEPEVSLNYPYFMEPEGSLNYPYFMEPEVSLPHSQVPDTCPYP
jgi:hypothetical protein